MIERVFFKIAVPFFKDFEKNPQNTYMALSGCFRIATVFDLSPCMFYCNIQIFVLINELPFERKMLSQE